MKVHQGTVHANARPALVLVGSLAVIAASLVGWTVMAGQADPGTDGFTFEEVSTERGLGYQFEGTQVVNGNAGAYVADYDNDGWQDLLLIGNESQGPVLYRNARGSFEPSDALPDAVRERRIHSALFFDYDNDGWEDLLLLPDPGKPAGGYVSGGSSSFSSATTNPVLLHNEQGTFGEPANLSSVTLQEYPIGATTADYDGDGCLDVFIYQNGDWADRSPAGFQNPESIDNISDDNGEPNLLLQGNCRGEFTDVSDKAGISGERWSLSASFVDLTGDSRPDLHVANDFNQDVIYVNQGDGTFEQRRLEGTDRNGMSSEIGDLNGDGRPDIYVTNIGMASREGADLSKDTGGMFDKQAASESPRYVRGNQVLVNRGNATFVDRAAEYGVKEAPFVWGWAAITADLDNDVDLDVVHTNNEKSSVTGEGQQVLIRWEDTPPGVWENVGTLSNPEYESLRGDAIGLIDMNARGLVRIDYDRDGDLDIVAADEDNSVKLLENQVRTRHWLQIRVGDGRSADTLGATAHVTTSNGTQVRFFNARVDFLSQETPILHAGLGPSATVDRLRVVWPDGTERVFEDVRANRRIAVRKNGSLGTVGK